MSEQNLQQDVVANLLDLGWALSENPTLRDFSLGFLNQAGPEFEESIQSLQSIYVQDRDWKKGEAEWEKGIPLLDRIQMREEFLDMCLRKSVPSDVLKVFKQRWELGQFSEVSEKYLVLNDIWVKRTAVGKLVLKSEVDIPGKNAGIGRKDVTYDVWDKIADGVEAVRPKINGERFVRSGNQFVGPFVLTIESETEAEVLELYAGEYYVIWPVTTASSTVILSIENKKKGTVKLMPHPYQSIHTLSDIKESYKYDGIMLKVGKEEYRLKFYPSMECLVDGEVWEVALQENVLRYIRPRKGKEAHSNARAVQALLMRMVSYRAVEQRLRGKPMQVSTVFEKAGRSSAKVLVMTPKGFLLYKEGDKPWDFPGGQVEQGEMPVESAVRELQEELNIGVSTDDLVFFHEQNAEGDFTQWRNYVFLCWLEDPGPVLKRSDVVEIVHMGVSAGRPRQIWAIKIMEEVGAKATRSQLLAILSIMGNRPVFHGMSPPKDCLEKMVHCYKSVLYRVAALVEKPTRLKLKQTSFSYWNPLGAVYEREWDHWYIEYSMQKLGINANVTVAFLERVLKTLTKPMTLEEIQKDWVQMIPSQVCPIVLAYGVAWGYLSKMENLWGSTQVHLQAQEDIPVVERTVWKEKGVGVNE